MLPVGVLRNRGTGARAFEAVVQSELEESTMLSKSTWTHYALQTHHRPLDRVRPPLFSEKEKNTKNLSTEPATTYLEVYMNHYPDHVFLVVCGVREDLHGQCNFALYFLFFF